MKGIGVDVENDYYYVSVDTIPQTKQVVSQVIKGFKKEHGDGPDAPKLMIIIHSLDMLMTETEEENFAKGVTKGDQGQRNKQLKAMLREFVQAIKRPNINMIVTAQVYKNQDVRNGEGVWIVSDAIKFSLSQVVLLTKLKMRDKATRIVHGIFMKVEGYKTRFSKPFQTATIDVPYETGMDPYSGLLDVVAELGLVTKKGGWYSVTGEEKKWYAKDFHIYAERLLKEAEALSDVFLDAKDETDEDVEKQETFKSKRAAKAIGG